MRNHYTICKRQRADPGKERATAHTAKYANTKCANKRKNPCISAALKKTHCT